MRQLVYIYMDVCVYLYRSIHLYIHLLVFMNIYKCNARIMRWRLLVQWLYAEPLSPRPKSGPDVVPCRKKKEKQKNENKTKNKYVPINMVFHLNPAIGTVLLTLTFYASTLHYTRSLYFPLC